MPGSDKDAAVCAVVLALLLAGALPSSARASQPALDVKELAEYRLTAPVLARFGDASRRIGALIRADPALATAPLFTRDILVLGDAPAAAAELDVRLRSHPGLAGALRAAKISSREYTKFALALFAARLAHGFMQAGVLRLVPPGVAADNVKFVDDHHADIVAILRELGVEEQGSGIGD